MALSPVTTVAVGTVETENGIDYRNFDDGGRRLWLRVAPPAAHDAVSLNAGSDVALTLTGQELNLTLPPTVVNLATTVTGTTNVVTNDAGNDATLNSATAADAGLMSAADKVAHDLNTTARHPLVNLAAGSDGALTLVSATQELNLTLPPIANLTQPQAVDPVDTTNFGQVSGQLLKAAFDTHIAGVGNFGGTHDAGAGALPSGAGIVAGDYVRVTNGGTMPVGIAGGGNVADANDIMYALVDNPAVAADWALAKSANPGTNLTLGAITATNITIESDTGNNAIVPPATTTEAGLMSAADKVAHDAAVLASHPEVTLNAAAAAQGLTVNATQELNLQQALTGHTDVDLALKTLADGRTIQREAGVWVNGSWTKVASTLPADTEATNGDFTIRADTGVAGLDGIYRFDAVGAGTWVQAVIWNP